MSISRHIIPNIHYIVYKIIKYDRLSDIWVTICYIYKTEDRIKHYIISDMIDVIKIIIEADPSCIYINHTPVNLVKYISNILLDI